MADQESLQYPQNWGSGGVGGASPTVVSSPADSPEYEIIFEVIYSFVPDDEYPCKATVHVYIEAENDTGRLPLLLRNCCTELFFSKLTAAWGRADERDGRKYRYNYIYISERTWIELEKEVERVIEQTKNTLVIVKEENLAKLRSKPNDFIKVLKI
jgi:hypothetical protein